MGVWDLIMPGWLFCRLMPTVLVARPFLSPLVQSLLGSHKWFAGERLFKVIHYSLLSRMHMSTWMEGSEEFQSKVPPHVNRGLCPQSPPETLRPVDVSCTIESLFLRGKSAPEDGPSPFAKGSLTWRSLNVSHISE